MTFIAEEYGWNDINVVMLGRPVIGVVGLRYTERQNKANIYAKGKRPVARGRGNVEYEGEIRLLLSELKALQVSLGKGKSINSIRPFDIVCAYAPAEGGVITTDTLKYVEFMETNVDLNQGDDHFEVTLPVIIGSIEFNV